MSNAPRARQLHLSLYWFAAGIFPLTFLTKGDIVLYLNGLHTPFTDWFFKNATYLGDGIVFAPTIIACLFIRFRYAIIAAGAGLVHCVLVALCKRIVFGGVPRPAAWFTNADALHFVPHVQVHTHMSFPSGHTATAFALALFISLIGQNRWLTCFMLSMATVIGISRIYLLQHFYVDVYAGMVLGTFSTLLVWQLCHAFSFFNRTDARLTLGVSMPRPSHLSETKP
ncbi:phosphatase PAP2 family protein [Roseivirga sp. BDSF3-8]|uniref:phosphatase PAP2 family protein n=1 Tax=Roseivirga sp. BDSF3-8 TaxID=3241598 RepID=UPI0035326388